MRLGSTFTCPNAVKQTNERTRIQHCSPSSLQLCSPLALLPVTPGEWGIGGVGEWESGRVGEWESGKVGEWESSSSFSNGHNTSSSSSSRAHAAISGTEVTLRIPAPYRNQNVILTKKVASLKKKVTGAALNYDSVHQALYSLLWSCVVR